MEDDDRVHRDQSRISASMNGVRELAQTNEWSDDLVERIQIVSTNLSDGAKRVARFLLSRPEDVAMLSAAKISDAVGVSESTVVRLATALGYDGYPELRRAAQDSLRRHLDPASRLDIFTHDVENLDVVGRSFRADMADLANTQRQLDVGSLQQAAGMILNANKVYILGARSSFSLAFTLYHHLSRTIRSVHLLENAGGDAVDQFSCLETGDVVVGIGFPRYTRRTVELLSLASSYGARIISVTDSQVSPLAQLADVVLTATCSADPFANSNVGALAVINALVSQAAVADKENSMRRLNRLDQLLRDGDVIYSDGAGGSISHAPRGRRPSIRKGRFGG